MNRGGRLPSHSKKRRSEIPDRRRLVQRVLRRDGHRCQFYRHLDGATVPADEIEQFERSLPPGCARYDSLTEHDVHEIIARDVWKDGYLVDDNCVTLCRAHHDWVTTHGRWAAMLKLHGFSWDVPGRYPNGDRAQNATSDATRPAAESATTEAPSGEPDPF